MTTTTQARAEHLELRATSQEKQLLQAAAAEEHVDVTTFILRRVVPAAREIVDRAERIQLSERDTRRVLELLENPPKPTNRLVAAAKAKRRAR